jgi:putative two-component system response regulator
MRVLIVDDDEIALELLSEVLSESGHEVERAKNGREALEILREGLFQIVISDWEMPEMSGIELCRNIRERHLSNYVYTILVTARDGRGDVVEGLSAGADDFVTKPFEPSELSVRLKTAERLLALESRNVTIFTLAKLAESRSPETGAHLDRIREYSRVVAQELGKSGKYSHVIDANYVQLIYLTSPLHDIGKVGIPDSVLLKAGPLTDREFEIMKSHVMIGAQTLDAAARMQRDVEFLRMARDIALTHHERFDGSGYPRGLAGEQIPLCGRIVAIADVYDALTVRRVYKNALQHDVAASIIREEKARHFDPDIVDAFFRVEDKILQIQQRFADESTDEDTFKLFESAFGVAAYTGMP